MVCLTDLHYPVNDDSFNSGNRLLEFKVDDVGRNSAGRGNSGTSACETRFLFICQNILARPIDDPQCHDLEEFNFTPNTEESIHQQICDT